MEKFFTRRSLVPLWVIYASYSWGIVWHFHCLNVRPLAVLYTEASLSSEILLFVRVTNYCTEWFVDVEDVAKLCVVGLLDEGVKSQRIFAFGEQTNWNDVVPILRELRPDNKKIPDPPKDEIRDRTEILPRTRAQILLRGFFDKPDFTSIKESIANGIEGWD